MSMTHSNIQSNPWYAKHLQRLKCKKDASEANVKKSDVTQISKPIKEETSTISQQSEEGRVVKDEPKDHPVPLEEKFPLPPVKREISSCEANSTPKVEQNSTQPLPNRRQYKNHSFKQPILSMSTKHTSPKELHHTPNLKLKPYAHLKVHSLSLQEDGAKPRHHVKKSLNQNFTKLECKTLESYDDPKTETIPMFALTDSEKIYLEHMKKLKSCRLKSNKLEMTPLKEQNKKPSSDVIASPKREKLQQSGDNNLMSLEQNKKLSSDVIASPKREKLQQSGDNNLMSLPLDESQGDKSHLSSDKQSSASRERVSAEMAMAKSSSTIPDLHKRQNMNNGKKPSQQILHHTEKIEEKRSLNCDCSPLSSVHVKTGIGNSNSQAVSVHGIDTEFKLQDLTEKPTPEKLKTQISMISRAANSETTTIPAHESCANSERDMNLKIDVHISKRVDGGSSEKNALCSSNATKPNLNSPTKSTIATIITHDTSKNCVPGFMNNSDTCNDSTSLVSPNQFVVLSSTFDINDDGCNTNRLGQRVADICGYKRLKSEDDFRWLNKKQRGTLKRKCDTHREKFHLEDTEKQYTLRTKRPKSKSSERRVVPILQDIGRDSMEVCPSRPHVEDEYTKITCDDMNIAGVEFIQPISGYHCRLCKTFYFDYPTAMHHCTLLSHKMKVIRDESERESNLEKDIDQVIAEAQQVMRSNPRGRK